MTDIEWKFKEGPCWNSDEFWYDLTDGGYIKLAELLEDKNQIELLQNAITIIKSFEDALEAFDAWDTRV